MSEIPPPSPMPPMDYVSPTNPDKSWSAITSLICGIVAVVPGGCCCLVGWPAAIAGIIFGVIGIKSQKSTLAKIGIGLSVLGFLITILLWILNAIFHFAVPGARGPGM